MPRRRKRAEFELGKFWLSTIPRRRGYYAFWTDSGNGGTRRQSLGTEDIQEAKLKLAEIVLRGAPASATTPFSIVLENYFIERTDKLPSKEAARHAGKLLLEHWGANAKAQDVTIGRQKDFAEASARKGHSLGYISRNLSVASAALHHAGMQVKIITSEEFMRDGWKIKAKPRRKPFVPTDQQIALILRQDMPEDLARWLLIAMATGCRPEAAIDLSPAARVLEANAIDLNPQGRVQTKKRRPIVKCPKSLKAALDRWERAGLEKHGGRYCGYASVDSVDSALERVCKPLGLGRMSVGSIRHKVATVMRAAGVPSEQVNRQLGHAESDTTSAGYGEYSPAFQREATEAIETWVRRVRALRPGLKSH